MSARRVVTACLFLLCAIHLFAAGSAAAEQKQGSFGSVTFGAKIVNGRPADPSFQFPAGTREIFAFFNYSGIAEKAHWSWRLSREGGGVDESYKRSWEAKPSGSYVLPITFSGESGIYDLDLYLDGKLARLSSFIIGSPAPPDRPALQADDFEQEKSNWGAVEGGPGNLKIENGRTVMTLAGGNGGVWKRSGKPFAHAIIEVDAAPLKDSDAAGFGIVFRSKDSRNFYAFVINPQGQFAVFMVEGGNLVWKQNWTAEAPGVIRKGAATNRLRVLGDGFLLRLYVNGYYVGALNEVFRGEGEAGILVFGQGKPGSQVAFSRWRVWPLAEKYDVAYEKAPWIRFSFATPGQTTVDESLQRLGVPYLDYKTTVVEDEIDVMGEPSMLDMSVYNRAKARGVNVSEVRVLVWNLGNLPPMATFVFRGDKLWYANYPAAPSDATPEQLASRYGKPTRTSTQDRRAIDILYTVKVYGYPEKGHAFTQTHRERIESKFVFPPSAELPPGLR